MYKVVVIDDEYYLRKALIACIDWNELGFEICAEAQNGQQGYDLICDKKADLAIVDVNMPIVDGLSMIKKLRNNNNDIIIILLSGYSEFEYAQKAIKYKVRNYLLKPLEENELIDELLKIKIELDSKAQINDNNLIIYDKTDNLILKIKKYVYDNYHDENLSIQQICDYLNFNYHYISKIFKDKTNESLGKFIFNVRMQKAKLFLDQGEYRLDIISNKTGYSDTLYFSKCFKKHYGITPNQYIKKYKYKK